MSSRELNNNEPHPLSYNALEYINNIGYEKLIKYQESFSSCAIEGNRTGEICSETLRRLLNKEKISDRYLLGLAWAIKEMEDLENDR